MAKLSWEWEDAWAIYPYVEPEMKEDILGALESMLPTVSPSAQIKALESAPMPVIKKYAHLLHDRAKKSLGLEANTVKPWNEYLRTLS